MHGGRASAEEAVITDDGPFSDNISKLWGPAEGGPLEPARNGAPAWDPNTAGRAPAKEAKPPAVDEKPEDGVAALVDALTNHRVDVVSKAELAAVRSELEGAFTHQLAAALYEMLHASSDRVASAEGHIDQRLDSIVDRLRETIEAQADRLAALIDAQRRVAAEEAAGVRCELATVREQLAAVRARPVFPIDSFAHLQREMRHEVGRIGDAVVAQDQQLDRRAAAEAEKAAADRAELWQRVEQSEARVIEATGQLGDVSERIASLQDDVTTLGDATAKIRQAVESRRRKGRRARSKSAD